jgi:psiF repeat
MHACYRESNLGTLEGAMTMLRTLGLIGVVALIPILLTATPTSALTRKEKMETCKIGADHEKLTGAKRKHFISRCMAGEHAKRKPAKKSATKKSTAKKTSSKKTMTNPPPPTPKQ